MHGICSKLLSRRLPLRTADSILVDRLGTGFVENSCISTDMSTAVTPWRSSPIATGQRARPCLEPWLLAVLLSLLAPCTQQPEPRHRKFEAICAVFASRSNHIKRTARAVT